jgi:hypothetical protein
MSSLLVIFVWGGVRSNFVGSESGHEQSVKLLQNKIGKSSYKLQASPDRVEVNK